MRLEKITPFISIKHFLGIHKAGTKFYEMFLFYNGDQSRSFLVKRWGKIGNLGTGGQEITITSEDNLEPLAPSASYNRTILDKEKSGYIKNVGDIYIDCLFPKGCNGSELRREIASGVVFCFDTNSAMGKAVKENLLDIFKYDLLAKVVDELYGSENKWSFEDIDLSEIPIVTDEERGEEWGAW